MILVLGSERLHIDMFKRFDGTKTSTDEVITVVKLDKSGGCVDREDTFMQQTREASMKEYFFGDSKRTLSPHIQQIDFSALTIYKLREGKQTILKFQGHAKRISSFGENGVSRAGNGGGRRR